jgi:Na+-driven multidrug efflux pump
VSCSEMLLRIFIKDTAVITEGSHYLHIVGPAYICFAVMFVSNGIMNGSGHTSVSTIVTLVSQWLFRVPMAFWLSDHLHNVQGVWYAIAFSFFVSTIVSLCFYFSGFWKKPVVRRKPITASPEATFGDGAGEM